MSQKEDIEKMLESGQGYDEIEDKTGSKRSYIRSLAVEYRKRDPKEEASESKASEPETLEKKESEPGMNFVDDEPEETKSKSGGNYHKEWVKKAKYECGKCGATIGRSSSFCPHCGETLMWEGIE